MHRHTSNQSNASARPTSDPVRAARRRVKLARKANRATTTGRSAKAWKS